MHCEVESITAPPPFTTVIYKLSIKVSWKKVIFRNLYTIGNTSHLGRKLKEEKTVKSPEPEDKH